MANQSENHSKLVNQVLIELGKRYFDTARAWKNHTGQAFTPGSVTDALNCVVNGGTFLEARDLLVPIRFGVPGQADISGLIKGGRRLEIEIKTGSGKLHEGQKNFRDMILDLGGLHIECRSLSDLDMISQIEMFK
jgi:hypothetical protein